ncbi:helix-turn-helix domain-containing protein [Streptomyces sp. SAI-097]
MRHSLRLLSEESAEERAGSSFARRQYGRLLLLEILRAYAGASELSPEWLRAQADDRLRPALAAMHAHPGKPWRLHDLAGTARMSGTAFAVRFRAAAGVPPHAYLTRWRMLLARRALAHDEVTVAALATQLGYGSESSFSHAFKREVGESPSAIARAGSTKTGDLRSSSPPRGDRSAGLDGRPAAGREAGHCPYEEQRLRREVQGVGFIPPCATGRSSPRFGRSGAGGVFTCRRIPSRILAAGPGRRGRAGAR